MITWVFIGKWIAVLIAAFAVDVAFTYYVRRAAEGRAIPAAVWSGVIALFNAFNVLVYVKDQRLVVPLIIGYVVGTYVAVKRDHKPKAEALHIQVNTEATAEELERMLTDLLDRQRRSGAV